MSRYASRSTLLHCFMLWAETSPRQVYMTQPMPGGQTLEITWGEAADQVKRVANHIKSLNLPAQSSIALLGRNSAHWILADLAIWMAGHVTVPLYPTLNWDTAEYVLDHAEVKLLMIGKMDGVADGWNDIGPNLPEDLPKIGLPLCPRSDIPQWKDIVAGTEPVSEVVLPATDALATIVYTSGSTGRPKGVMHSFGTMVSVANALRDTYKISRNERMLSYLPLAHVAERAVVETASLYFGFQVFFADKLETFQQDLQRARPTVFFSVPRLWTKFYLAINEKLPPSKQKVLFNLPIISTLVKRKILKQLGLDQVRLAITASAPLPPNILQWYHGIGLELLDVYGMSENFGYSHGSRPGEVRPGYVGHANPGVQCKIADNGEVLVKSPGQMMGYYKAPEKTAEDLTDDGFLKTGDRGEIDEQGRLKITGRVKELFKCSKGKYIAPVPIEQKLNNHPKVEVICVTGPGQPQPFALFMLSLDAQAELKDGRLDKATLTEEFKSLLASVNATLEDHEKLDYVVVVKDQWTMDNGYLTPTMKIKRNIIEDRYLPNADAWLAMRQKVVWED
ncbi:AMP-binding protein [Perlucidibaca piscinae]|uniref:AMP-binding protein n=1 Tax=Perlucidibaca piscinae TaxID=392589 RepID=UPI0003B50F36|nr:AMP-binding protein [Perlucidibaca piscinae]